MNMFDRYNEYTQNLLSAQYDVSEIIEHLLIRGEVREDFLIDIIQKRFDNSLTIKKGIVTDGNRQSNQADILLCKDRRQIYTLGNQVSVNADDCLMVLEVKSNATGRDFKKFDQDAKLAKSLCSNNSEPPLCGLFCYRFDLKKKTLLKRFGYRYDEFMDIADYDETLSILYSNIDFVLSIEPDNLEYGVLNRQLYIRKELGKEKYHVSFAVPTIQNLFSLIQSLVWRA